MITVYVNKAILTKVEMNYNVGNVIIHVKPAVVLKIIIVLPVMIHIVEK